MPKTQAYLLSIVVPVFNESTGLSEFHSSLIEILQQSVKDFEVIYCDDGSLDDTAKLISEWHQRDPRIKLIAFSRNFGKERALSAGIAQSRGQAILMLDGDGQHPVELIPEFIKAWKGDAQVVIGLRTDNTDISWFKHLCSRLFYKVFNKLAGQKLVMGATDFRLIDRSVQQAFLTLPETDRITRGLIDWLGFRREYIRFSAKKRQSGSPSYSLHKLIGLAANSFTSLTPKPLFLFGYLGVFITIASFLLGVLVIIEQLILGDPLHWKFTGTAMLGILLLFLVGIVLMSQGILSLYVSRIHNQSMQRPLYVIDYVKSVGIETRVQH
jgi:glycosyltransferase involved in cell wall biosynthesis